MDLFEVSCPICFDKFSLERIPMTLRCGHTICNICLLRQVKAIKEENEESENDSDSENESIMISKCLICRCSINSRFNEQTINISLMSNIIRHNKILYCSTCSIFFYYTYDKKIDACFKSNHKILTVKCLMEKISEIKSQLTILNSIYIKDEVKNNINLIKDNFNLLNDKIMKKHGEHNKSINSDIQIIKEESFTTKNILQHEDIVALFHSNLIEKKKRIYEYFLYLNYNLKSLQKMHLMIREEITKTLSSTYSYYLLGNKEFERIFTIQFILNSKKILVYKADEKKCSKITIDSLPNVFNESIKIEINPEGNLVYIIGGSFEEDKPGNQFYSVNIKDQSNPILKKLVNLKFIRNNPAILHFNNKIFAIGGEKDEDPFSQCEYYDVIKGKWIELPSLNSEIIEPSICVLKNNLYCSGVCDYTKLNFEVLNLMTLEEWKILGIEIKEPIMGYLLVNYDFCSMIILGGTYVDQDEDEDEECYFNEDLYLVNIADKNYTKIISKDNEINYEFNTVPAFYKNKIIGYDFPEEDRPILFNFDIESNKFNIY